MGGVKNLLKKIASGISEIKEVKAILLYGSFARGDFTPRSDIDLFIITSKDARDKIESRVITIENLVQRSIQPTIRTENQLKTTDSGLLQNIFREGKILFLREYFEFPVPFLLGQKPFIIYKFDIANLRQKSKARFNRELYGYKDGKYAYEGLIHRANGNKLSAGCIIVPFSSKRMVEQFFRKKKVKTEGISVWKES
ncbi:MAG: nucleotidyltransferase domain-containing protein [Nanoarchaeota archaeon]|nr:nucleotidyltransferase domain-containing protein [Nanoarchaeota archaeon]